MPHIDILLSLLKQQSIFLTRDALLDEIEHATGFDSGHYGWWEFSVQLSEAVERLEQRQDPFAKNLREWIALSLLLRLTNDKLHYAFFQKFKTRHAASS